MALCLDAIGSRTRRPEVRRGRWVTAVAVFAVVVHTSCGDAARLDEIERASIEQQARSFRLAGDWRPRTEVEKIHALLDAVASSDATFLMGRRSWDGPRTRDFLRRRYVRAASRIVTAEQFIVGVATRQRVTNAAYEVRLSSGRRVDLRDWLREELDRIEAEDLSRHQQVLASHAVPSPAAAPAAPATGLAAPPIDTDDLTKLPASIDDPVSKERAVPNTIAYVIALARHSRATFLAPTSADRRRRSADVTRYDGPDFAAMLRRKSTWIGAGIDDVDAWLEEVGSRSFRHDVPYEVEHPDGQVETFRAWVESRRHGPATPTAGGPARDDSLEE